MKRPPPPPNINPFEYAALRRDASEGEAEWIKLQAKDGWEVAAATLHPLKTCKLYLFKRRRSK